MAARKGGLGRGLDALIPAKKPAEQTPAEKPVSVWKPVQSISYRTAT